MSDKNEQPTSRFPAIPVNATGDLPAGAPVDAEEREPLLHRVLRESKERLRNNANIPPAGGNGGASGLSR